MIIRITNLRLRAIVGANDWERHQKQDVIVNVELSYDGSAAAESDDLADALDYKALKQSLMAEVTTSRCHLLERLCDRLVQVVLADERVERATVTVDKPGALRYCDSVSVTCTGERGR